MDPIPTDETADLLVALIRNRCVNDGTADSGQEHRSVATLAGYLGEPEAVFEPHRGRQSALYRVPGRSDRAPRLLLLGHTDVVPVSDEGWSVDPFAGERRTGMVWGRGAVDMLNQTASMAVVFRRFLTGEAPRPAGDLMFLAVADEEAAGKLGSGWITEHHWDQVRCDYLLTEIGAPMLHGRLGPGLPVTVAEKGPHWRLLRSSGVPGHGSQPYGTENAIVPLARALAGLSEAPPPVVISSEWRRFVEAWDPDPDLAAALLDARRVDATVEALAADDLPFARWVHACTHMTVSSNTMRAGSKFNIVPDRGVAEIDIRLCPGQPTGEVGEHLRAAMGSAAEEIEIVEVESTPAGGSPARGPLWDAIGDALQATLGHRRLLPTLVPVSTDARFFRHRGTVAYGMAVFDDRVGFGDLLAMFHGNDERVSEAALGLTTDHLMASIIRFGELVS